jgi:NIMA (never in mitosis gene a)-related kinase
MQRLSFREKENALNEVRILASIEHECIIGYKEAFFDDPYLCLVMDLADQEDLYH